MSNINNYEPSIIAQKIKKECMRHNVTLKDMLQELSANKDTIYHMTRGTAISYITLARICDYLDISVDTLLDRPAPVIPGSPNLANLDTAISTVATAANLSADYVRGVLRLPPNGNTNTNDI